MPDPPYHPKMACTGRISGGQKTPLFRFEMLCDTSIPIRDAVFYFCILGINDKSTR